MNPLLTCLSFIAPYATQAPTRGRRKVQSSDEEGEDSDEEDEDEEEEVPAPRGGKRKPAPAPAKKAPAKRGAKADSDEESEASEEGEASEESDDSDLFDSEEEELISKRVQDGKEGKVLGGKRKAAESDDEGRAVSTRSNRRAAAKYESDDGASDVSRPECAHDCIWFVLLFSSTVSACSVCMVAFEQSSVSSTYNG
jgi:hypothetical protein